MILAEQRVASNFILYSSQCSSKFCVNLAPRFQIVCSKYPQDLDFFLEIFACTVLYSTFVEISKNQTSLCNERLCLSSPDAIVVVVLFKQNDPFTVLSDEFATIQEIREDWEADLKASPSVAFLSTNNRLLSEELTIERALLESGRDSSDRVLELRASPAS